MKEEILSLIKSESEKVGLDVKSVENGLVALIVERIASQEFFDGCKKNKETPTPANETYERQGPGGGSLTYVMVAHMIRQLRQAADRYVFECIAAPHMPVVQRPDGPHTLAFYCTTWVLHCFKGGVLVSSTPAIGTCDIQLSTSGGDWIGIETAYKGCVTDAIKKGISLAVDAAHDIYKYGATKELTTEDYVEKIEAEFPIEWQSLADDKTGDTIEFIAAAKSAADREKRYQSVRTKLEKLRLHTQNDDGGVHGA